jgi:hypothetical protein
MFEGSRLPRAAKAIRTVLYPLLWLVCSDARIARVARHLVAIGICTGLIAWIFRKAGSGSTPAVWALAAAGALIYYFPIQFAMSRILSRLEPLPPLKRRVLIYAQFLLVLVSMGAIVVWLHSLVP